MKGVVFSEFINWVEQTHSPALADAMIVRAGLPNDGSYTSVGNYPHEQAVAMIDALAAITGQPWVELADAYGYWLAHRFVELYPQIFVGYTDAISFLYDLDDSHQKVMTRLYPDLRTPTIIADLDGGTLTIRYASHRPFADVTFGLMRGYVDYFGDDLTAERDATIAGSHEGRFIFRPRG